MTTNFSEPSSSSELFCTVTFFQYCCSWIGKLFSCLVIQFQNIYFNWDAIYKANKLKTYNSVMFGNCQKRSSSLRYTTDYTVSFSFTKTMKHCITKFVRNSFRMNELCQRKDSEILLTNTLISSVWRQCGLFFSMYSW